MLHRISIANYFCPISADLIPCTHHQELSGYYFSSCRNTSMHIPLKTDPSTSAIRTTAVSRSLSLSLTQPLSLSASLSLRLSFSLSLSLSQPLSLSLSLSLSQIGRASCRERD